ncbi:MAG: hypothetical protein U0797_16530 [Gemmataceae bacterium]
MLAGLSPDRLASVAVRRDGGDVAQLERTFSDGYVTTGNWPASSADARRVFDVVGGLHSRFVAEASTQEKLPVTLDVLTRDDVALAAAAMAGKSSPTTRSPRPPRGLRRAGQAAAAPRSARRPTATTASSGRPTSASTAATRCCGWRPGLVGELTRPGDLYRQRRLFPAERAARLNNAQERIGSTPARWYSTRRGSRPSGWFAAPTAGARPADAATTSTPRRPKLLTAVADLWAEQFAAPSTAAGLDRPRQSIRVTRHDGGVVTLLLGERSPARTPRARPGAPAPAAGQLPLRQTCRQRPRLRGAGQPAGRRLPRV